MPLREALTPRRDRAGLARKTPGAKGGGQVWYPRSEQADIALGRGAPFSLHAPPYHVQSPLRVMPGQQNGLRVVPCSQPDPLEPPGTTAPVRGVIVLLGVHCCFHGLVHRLRAVESSLRTLHRVRWRISGARRYAVPASVWRRCVTRLHSNRSRTPDRSVCPNGG